MLFAISNNRALLTIKFIPDDIIMSDIDTDESYVRYNEYEKVYKKLFGTSYPLKDDLTAGISRVEGDNVFFLNTLYCPGDPEFKVNNIYYNGSKDHYLIKGSYKQNNLDDQYGLEIYTGTFELIFNKQDGSYHIVSLIIKFNK